MHTLWGVHDQVNLINYIPWKSIFSQTMIFAYMFYSFKQIYDDNETSSEASLNKLETSAIDMVK